MEKSRNLNFWNNIQNNHYLMIFIILVLGVFSYLWGEKTPAGGGLGSDGVIYGNMVRNLEHMINDGQLSGYYAQRILPAAIVRGLMLSSGVNIDDAAIVRCFEIYNLILIIGACWIWKSIADNFSLSIFGRWIGFGGIFINFQCSKQSFYYPVLTDVTALFIAMLMLLFYIKRKPVALCIAAVVGAFCWPTISISGAVLIIFLRSRFPEEEIWMTPHFDASKPKRNLKTYKHAYFMIFAISVAIYIAKLLAPLSEESCAAFDNMVHELVNVVPFDVLTAMEKTLSGGYSCTLESLIVKIGQFFTALPSVFGLLIGIAMLLGSKEFLRTLLGELKKIHPGLAVLGLIAFILPLSMIRFISNPDIPNASSLAYLLRLSILPYQEGKFLLPLVTLAVFWGPVVLLLVLRWNAFCTEARKLGLGIVLLICISLPFGLVGEPRFMTVAWPFLVLGMVLVLEKHATETGFKHAFIILTVVYAQFWLKINVGPWSGSDLEGHLDFPKQLSFMHYGLWMSWLSYIVQFILIIFSFVWFYVTSTKPAFLLSRQSDKESSEVL